jgi:hypothetical protein
MAEEKKENRILRIEDFRTAGQVTVRYGRATLTVQRYGSVYLTPLQDELQAHRRGERSEQDVAWAFIKSRVVTQSPTFDWAQVELDKLLPRVTAITKDPEIKAQDPGKLVAELETIEKEEKEQWAETSKRMKRHLAGFTGELFKGINNVSRPAALARPNYLDTFKALTPKTTVLDSMRIDVEQMQKVLIPQVNLATLGINQVALDGFRSLASQNLTKNFLASSQILAANKTWMDLAQQVSAAAKEVEAQDIAETVEEAADEAAKEPAALDLTAVTDRLDILIEEQKRAADGDSAARQIVIGVAIILISSLLAFILATKFGVQLNPPQDPPSKVQPDKGQ